MVHQDSSGSLQKCHHSTKDKRAQKILPVEAFPPFQQSWLEALGSGFGGDWEKEGGCAGHQDVDEGLNLGFMLSRRQGEGIGLCWAPRCGRRAGLVIFRPSTAHLPSPKLGLGQWSLGLCSWHQSGRKHRFI